MFRPARWRSEKNKIKAVFRLLFHATQVTRVGVDALTISIIPADIGKPTTKLEKATVRDGSCHWENPVYETVKFDRESKSGKIHERIYRFVVGTGSSKARVVGEVSIDFSNYAEATKISSVSLPLKNSKSDILLHVSIQRLHDSEDQREVEESETEKVNSQDRSLRAQLNNGEVDESDLINRMENETLTKMIPQNGDLNGNRRTSSGSDVTLSSSDSSSGLDTPVELQLKINNIHQDPVRLLSSLNHASGEVSTDDSSSTPREALQRISSQGTSDDVVEKLKSELTALARQAEVSELELQTLRKQIVKESKKGQDLSREVISLKKERDSLREDCEKLKSIQKHLDEAKTKNILPLDGGDLQAVVAELRQELNYEKDLNANLRIQLQKTQESNSELILAVRDLDEMLEQKNKEIIHLSNKSTPDDDAKHVPQANSKGKEEEDYDDDEEQKALEQLVKEHSDAKGIYLLEQKIMDLHSEIEIYRREKDELEVQMEQLALDYEILKQENHDMSCKLDQSRLQEQLKVQYECTSSFASVNELEAQIDNLENELKKRQSELSGSMDTIRELEAQVKDLEEELEKQAQGFETDLETLTRAKVEQEQRAIQAEETLRKTRWQNANTAERLQEEFRRLSMQMASTFEANEKLATKALMEANELRLHKSYLEEMLRKANEEVESLRDQYEARLHELSNQEISLSKQIEQMQSEIADKSMKLENQEKCAEETHRLLSQEILSLKADMETLSAENKSLSELADRKETLTIELECMQKSIKEMETLIDQGNNERTELEGRVAVVKKEAEESLRELNQMRHLQQEKESILANLQAELDAVKAQRDELQHSLYKDESEKEKLRKQVIQIKGELKKKEDALKSMEKKLKDANARAAASDGAKTAKTNKSPPVPFGTKEVANLREKIRLLESQIKLKEAALETSTNSFLEKEKDLQNKIDELEKSLEVLKLNSASFSEHIQVPIGDNLNSKPIEELRDTAECTSAPTFSSNEHNWPTSSRKSNDDDLPDKEQKVSAASSRDTDELLNEMASLKEKNKLMEDELKEMQERYSEISLKFAEVEGERQQLVMKLRNLKNAKKS